MAIFLKTRMSNYTFLSHLDIARFAMAMSQKDYKVIADSHESSGTVYVNPAVHKKNHLPDPAYLSGLTSKTTLPRGGPGGIERGVREKVIHDIGEDTYMTKPYFPSTSRGISPISIPLGGWATLTTKEMYQAAGLHSVVENVSFNVFNNIPTTVHKFEKGYKPVYTLHDEVCRLGCPIRRTPRPLELHQVLIMDFLTGNVDRNSFNLLISDATGEDGHHNILAIDHEGAFRYGVKGFNSLKESLENSNALKKAMEASYAADYKDLISWWQQHASAIKEAFDKNLKLIKDQRLSTYLEEQFQRRFETVNKALSDHVLAENAFSKPDATRVELKEFETQAVPNKTIESALPADSVEAVKAICEIYSSQNPKGKIALFAEFERLLSEMSPYVFMKLYKIALKTPELTINNNSLFFVLNYYIIRSKREELAEQVLNYERNERPGCITSVLRQKLKEI
jgi:hypothetical protein